VTERHQRKNRIHHRGINRRQTLGALNVIQQPRFCFAQCALAQRLPGQFLVKLQRAIRARGRNFATREADRSSQTPLSCAKCRRRVRRRARVPANASPAAQRTKSPWDDDAASPRRHLVNVQVEQFGRSINSGRIAGTSSNRQRRPERDKSERKSSCVSRPPRRCTASFARTMCGESCGSPASLSAKYALQVAFSSEGPPGINAPAAVSNCRVRTLICELGDALRIRLAQDVQIIDVVRFESGVGFEFANPIARLNLQRQQVIAPRSMACSRRSSLSWSREVNVAADETGDIQPNPCGSLPKQIPPVRFRAEIDALAP